MSTHFFEVMRMASIVLKTTPRIATLRIVGNSVAATIRVGFDSVATSGAVVTTNNYLQPYAYDIIYFHASGLAAFVGTAPSSAVLSAARFTGLRGLNAMSFPSCISSASGGVVGPTDLRRYAS